MVTAGQLTQASSILQEASSGPQVPPANVSYLQVLAEELWVARWVGGGILSELVEIILETISPFQEILDELAGDPGVIVSHAESVAALGAGVGAAATSAIGGRTQASQQWSGDAATAFLLVATGIEGVFRSYRDAATTIADSEVLIGERVGAVREYVADTAGDVVAELVAAAGQIGASIGSIAAAASLGLVILGPAGAVLGAGAAIAAEVARFAVWAYGFVSAYLANVMQVLQELLAAVTGLIGKVQNVGTCMERAAIVLEGGADPGRASDFDPDGGAADRFGTEPQAHDEDLAWLASDCYAPGQSGNLPSGYEAITDPADLRALGIDPALLDTSSGFQAAVYRGPNGEYVVAMRGTESQQEDIIEDAIGGATVSPQTADALALAQAIDRSGIANDTTYTGHSLGGRLAASASMYSGNPAVTFQAAGLSPATVDYIAAQNGQRPSQLLAQMENGQMRNYRTSDDPLTNVQENLGPLSKIAPDAPGTQIQLGGTHGLFGGHDLPNLVNEMGKAYPDIFH